MTGGENYRAAGVDIDAGEEAVRRIGPLVRTTYRPEVVGDIGGFGGLFDVSRAGYRDPLLVSATDGVGTKAEVARSPPRQALQQRRRAPPYLLRKPACEKPR